MVIIKELAYLDELKDELSAHLCNEINLFGAGKTLDYFMEWYKRNIPDVNIAHIFDNDESKWGKSIICCKDKKTIESPMLLESFDQDSVFMLITSNYWINIIKQIKTIASSKEIILYYYKNFFVDLKIKDLRNQGAKIGKNVWISEGSYLDRSHSFLIEIGDNVTLSNVTILTHDASTKMFLGYSKVGKVKIGSNVFIGHGCIILPNVSIGDKVIIGAGSVVTKNIHSNSVACGNPCRIISSYDEYVDKHKNQIRLKPVFHKYWAEKDEEEIRNMQSALNDDWGYDI